MQVFHMSCLLSNSQFDYTVSCATGATLASLVIRSTYRAENISLYVVASMLQAS